MHGKTDWYGSNHLLNTKTLTESTVSQWNSSGIFPEVDSKAKDMENCRYSILFMQKDLEKDTGHLLVLVLERSHYAADLETIETIFRIIVSANQLSLHRAIAEMCEEYETLHERTERPVMMGQSSSSLALSVIKTEVPVD